jgi:thiol:disulfide interchange protein DsbC
MKRVLLNLLAASLISITLPLMAAEKPADPELAAIHHQLQGVFPGLPADAVTRTPIEGLVQVVYGPNVLYLSTDGRYAIKGEMLDLKTSKNLTEEVKTGMRVKALSAIPESQMVVFAPKNPKHTVTVFTDIDCGYCRKLHNEIDNYMKQGIAIQYLFYPRAGIGSPSYQKAVNVWCSKDRKAAMTKAKSGATLPEKHCDNPVASDYETGQLLGVTGTPAMVTEGGYLLPGYVPAEKLAKILDELDTK